MIRAQCTRIRQRTPTHGGSEPSACLASVYGVGDTLEEALVDLSQRIRAALADRPIPDELTREIAVVIGDAA